MITDFFKYSADLRNFAPQMPTDARLEAMEPHYRPQYQKLVNMIGLVTYNLLKDYFAANPDTVDTTEGKAVNFIRGALANLTAMPYFKFEASQRNSTDNKLYRYQEDQQIEIYLDNAHTELNFLLDHLETNVATFADYANTDVYKIRQTLYIKNAAEFKRYYGAVNSSYFFNNVVFIIEEIQNEEMASRLKEWPVVTGDKLKWLVGKALVYETLSRACIQLDYTELPAGIRADVQKDTNTRTAKGMTTEADLKNAASTYFGNKADEYFLKIEDANNESRNSGVFVVPQSTVTEDDKFYMS